MCDKLPTASAVDDLNDALHTLAQPLTALSFVVGTSLLQTSPEAWRAALETAKVEILRAVAAMEAVRHAATALQAEEKRR